MGSDIGDILKNLIQSDIGNNTLKNLVQTYLIQKP
jgi:hypothetical protein